MQDWESFEKSLEGPWDALNPRHVDIKEPLYSHQSAPPTAAGESDVHKLWETRTEKDTNLAWILNKLCSNVQTKQQGKKIFYIDDIQFNFS